MELKGKTVLITGAAKRIGREIALTLAARGARILLHYRSSKKEAFALHSEICDAGGDALVFQANFSALSLDPAIRRFVGEVYKQAGRVDVLINNASDFYPTPFGQITEKDWDDLLVSNLKAPFFLAQEIGMRMVKQKSGKIVNMLDWTAERPSEDYLPYCIAKGGLLTATRGLAKVLAPHVQVVGIEPGPILPPSGTNASKKSKAAQKTLLKRFGHPNDIAAAVRFFVESTDFVTGVCLPVDGGALLA